ncbi:MAG: MFS transporter [Actinomycetaceae bacterium]|nr:MFS transporter [Actinomycetaceae bacterium]
MRSFYNLLLNTALANLTVNFFWFSYTFWLYLETRSVLVTAILAGSYFALMAIMGVPFGILVDKVRKKNAMLGAAIATTIFFALAFVFFLATPTPHVTHIGSIGFWVFFALLLAGSIVENIRSLALSTCVTLMIPDTGKRRAQANGMVGMVNGIAFAITSAFSGLAVGFLGFDTVLLLSVVLTLISLGHLVTVRIPEKKIAPAQGVPQKANIRQAWAVVIGVPGLLALIFFSTFNNLLSGVFSALLDPYGLELMDVKVWGLVYAIASFGFLIGSAAVARWGLGTNPLRMLLVVGVFMWLVSILFTLRESIPMLVGGIIVFMALGPVMEAAEQTILQRVVPFEKQGRVFGFAQAVEISAMPITSLGIGPIAEYFFIPYMESVSGQETWGWMLGEGTARGIALVFISFSTVGLVVNLVAFLTPQYRLLSKTYLETSPTTTVFPEDEGA